jgi:hypothetical protein
MDIEKIMDVYGSIGVKKKYFSHVLWVDGKKIPEEKSLYMRGFEAKRSDNSEFTLKVQNEIFYDICRIKDNGLKKTKKLILNKIRKEYPKYINPKNMMEIGIPKGLHKNLNDYKQRSPWVDGAIYANNYLNANFDKGSKPKLLYIKRVVPNRGYPQTSSLCVMNGMKLPKYTDKETGEQKEIFIIDKQKMLMKTVIDKLDDVLELIGIERNQIFSGYKRTSVLDFINEDNQEEQKEMKIIDKEMLKLIKKESKKHLDHLYELLKQNNYQQIYDEYESIINVKFIEPELHIPFNNENKKELINV